MPKGLDLCEDEQRTTRRPKGLLRVSLQTPITTVDRQVQASVPIVAPSTVGVSFLEKASKSTLDFV